MYYISDAILDGLTRGHSRTTYAEVFRGSEKVLDAVDLDITGGSVTVDGTAATRRRLSMKLAIDDPAMMPMNALDDLAPFGNEIRVHQKIEIDNGSTATFDLGVFRISEPKGADKAGTSISISAFDRSRTIARAELTRPYVVTPGLNYVTATQALINSRYNGTLYWTADTTTYVTPLALFDIGADPWKTGDTMAGAIGFEIFFDPSGNPIMRREPDPTTAPPVFNYVEGPTCTIISVQTALSDQPGYNGVVVIGEPPSGAPVYGEAWDTNQQSATYYKGPYGVVPKIIKSQYVTSTTQANDVAAAELRNVLGIAERVTFTAIPNPAHEVGDVIRLRRLASGVDDLYVIESFTLPLDVDGVMSVTARRRKFA